MDDTQKVPWDSRWREIPGFPGYWLSQYGQVFNMKRGSLVSPYYNQHHVMSVRMYSATLYQGQSRGYSRSVAKLIRELHNVD